jgi:hypothetical protein
MTLREFDLALYGYLVERGRLEELKLTRMVRLNQFLALKQNMDIKKTERERVTLSEYLPLPGDPKKESIDDLVVSNADFVEEI